MAYRLREDIEELKKALDGEGDNKGIAELISDDGTTKKLFGMVVTIDESTGAVTLTKPQAEA